MSQQSQGRSHSPAKPLAFNQFVFKPIYNDGSSADIYMNGYSSHAGDRSGRQSVPLFSSNHNSHPRNTPNQGLVNGWAAKNHWAVIQTNNNRSGLKKSSVAENQHFTGHWQDQNSAKQLATTAAVVTRGGPLATGDYFSRHLFLGRQSLCLSAQHSI